LDNTLGEPKLDLLFGVLDGVRAVANVSSDGEGKVTTDGARSGGEGVGGTENVTTSLDSVEAFPDHTNDGAGVHVLDQPREEGLASEISVVLLKVLRGSMNELEGDELEATLLESADDSADKGALDTVRLDHDVGALSVVGHFGRFLGGLGKVWRKEEENYYEE